MPSLGDLLAAARAIAAEAGAVILAYYAGTTPVEYKPDESPVTEADRASDRLITGRLRVLTPDVPVLSEEGAGHDARAGWRRFWCVDPLDGTKEFVKRSGEFTVNVALVEDGAPVLGVVHVPVLGRTYAAARGLGAFRFDGPDGVPIRVRRADPRRLTVAASRDHGGRRVTELIGRMKADGVAIETLRMGSSLKFCLVAEGAADFYPRLGPTFEWDTAAPQAIVEEAGGRVTDLDGRPLTYNKASLLNPWLVTAGDPALDWRRFFDLPG